MTNQTALARRYIFQVDLNYPNTPDWNTVPGRLEFKPNDTPTDQRDSHHDANGHIGYTRTAGEYGVELKISHQEDDDTHVIDPTHEYIKARAFSRYGRSSVLHFRYYDRNGNTDAWEGYGLATWAPDGGDDEQLDTVAITLKPSAVSPQLVQIANPVNATPVPVIASLVPATGGTAGGNLVTITGAYFTGATTAAHVKFGANNATSYTVVSDSKIVAIAPAGVAATVRVTVTNTNGASADTPSDDYTYA
jgi:hypothetical protein